MLAPVKVLVDADYFFYRAATAAEMEIEYTTDLTVIVGDFNEGKKIIKAELSKLRKRFETDDLVLTFTDTTNFRKSIAPTYKGNRIKRKPAGYKKLKEWGMNTWPSILWPSLEADDVLGILATKGDLTNFIIVSPDKDMQQIPCRIYNLKEEFTQTPEDAKRKLYEQCLTGDSTDGYSGCRGIGPKRADQILSAVKDEDYWPAVIKAYKEADQTEEDALQMLRLARILQVENWDEEKQVPILITP